MKNRNLKIFNYIYKKKMFSASKVGFWAIDIGIT
jgi:hypothetical protein